MLCDLNLHIIYVAYQPQKTISKKSVCNKRNPNPPCKPGFTTRKRPNGSLCCYKDYSKPQPKPQPTTQKRFKFKRLGKPTNTTKLKPLASKKCNTRNPEPPCKPGFTTRKRPNGSLCCYKDYSN